MIDVDEPSLTAVVLFGLNLMAFCFVLVWVFLKSFKLARFDY